MEASLTVECLERRIPSTALGLRLGETMSPHQILKKGIMSESWATCSITPSEAAHKHSKGTDSLPRDPCHLADTMQRVISKL